MSFRSGLLLGLAAGYVLGAKAGRERYEQLVKKWEQFTRSPGAQQFGAEVSEAANRAGETLGTKANEGVAKVTDLTREREDTYETSDLPNNAYETRPPVIG